MDKQEWAGGSRKMRPIRGRPFLRWPLVNVSSDEAQPSVHGDGMARRPMELPLSDPTGEGSPFRLPRLGTTSKKLSIDRSTIYLVQMKGQSLSCWLILID